MRKSIVVAGLLIAQVAAAQPRLEPMRAIDEPICDLLRAQVGDRCTKVVDDKRATIYRSGTPRGITRVVVSVPSAEGVLIGPALDFEGLDAIVPTIRDDGTGVAVELAATLADKTLRHAVIRCAPTGKLWKCTTVMSPR